MLNRTALVFVSLAAILGFALGGSVVWNLQFGYTAIQTIDTTQQHHSANAKAVQEWEKPEDALARYTWCSRLLLAFSLSRQSDWAQLLFGSVSLESDSLSWRVMNSDPLTVQKSA
jgi:hypothetical protein